MLCDDHGKYLERVSKVAAEVEYTNDYVGMVVEQSGTALRSSHRNRIDDRVGELRCFPCHFHLPCQRCVSLPVSPSSLRGKLS